MAIDVKLDYTPAFTLSTLQFQSETLNVIVTSLLGVLILVNIGSAVSKLVYFTRATNFSYSSWVRGFIFANSDDPLRILSWLLRRYAYRDPAWLRTRNRLRPSRLLVPLLARGLILVASVASIAITIPGEKQMPHCANGDYALRWAPVRGRPAAQSESACLDIPLASDLGTVRSSALYCWCTTFSIANFTPGTTSVVFGNSPATGRVATLLGNRNTIVGSDFYFEWKQTSRAGVVFRSDISSLDLDTHADIVTDAFRDRDPDCSVINSGVVEGQSNRFIWFSCDIDDIVSFNRKLESIIRGALVFEKQASKQRRIVVENGQFRFDSQVEDCPIDITVTRPIVNIVPQAITLALWFCVNLLVSYTTRKHGNALDAGFHLVKEALGHDCTSNPLETNVTRAEITDISLYKWHCIDGGGHVGFLGREGDVPVAEFGGNTVVGGCARAAADFGRGRDVLDRYPVPPSAPRPPPNAPPDSSSGGPASKRVRYLSKLYSPAAAPPPPSALPGVSGASASLSSSPSPHHGNSDPNAHQHVSHVAARDPGSPPAANGTSPSHSSPGTPPGPAFVSPVPGAGSATAQGQPGAAPYVHVPGPAVTTSLVQHPGAPPADLQQGQAPLPPAQNLPSAPSRYSGPSQTTGGHFV